MTGAPTWPSAPQTSLERVRAVAWRIVANRFPGGVVECGVWKDGNAMAITKTLVGHGDTSCRISMCDSFSGMTEPPKKTPIPSALSHRSTCESLGRCGAIRRRKRCSVTWKTVIQFEKVLLVRGMVEHTIPQTLPDRIALLRLDTDWYEWTANERRRGEIERWRVKYTALRRAEDRRSRGNRDDLSDPRVGSASHLRVEE